MDPVFCHTLPTKLAIEEKTIVLNFDGITKNIILKITTHIATKNAPK